MLSRRLPLALVALAALGSPAPGQTTANIGTNFTANTTASVVGVTGSSFSVPPDTVGAVGPNYWVSYSNGGEFSVWNKAGTRVLDISEATFWQTKVGLGTGVVPSGDPRIIFDPLSGRWFAVAFTHPGSSGINNQLLIARSDTADPTGTWKGTTIDNSDNLFRDFPTLGVDRNGVYIGTNNFNSAGTGQGPQVYSIPKSDLLASSPTVANRTSIPTSSLTTAAPSGTPWGVTNFNLGQTSSTAAVLLGPGGSTTWRSTPLTGTGSAGASLGSTTSVAVTSAYTTPNPVTQPNATSTAASSTKLAGNDTRQPGYAFRVGDLVYFVHGTILNNRDALQLEVFDYSGATPVLKAEKILAETGFDYTYGTVAANANGTIVVGFTRTGFISNGSSSNRWPTATAVVGNLSGSTLTFGSPIELKLGQRDYTSYQGTGVTNRWGDYSATHPDPADPGIFWTLQEYAAATADGVTDGNGGFTNWGIQASEIIPTVTGEVRWKTAAGGNFTDTANWFNGAVPGTSDHAIFSRDGDGSTNYTVTFPSAATTTNARASIRQGVVTFNIPSGSAYTLTQTGTSTPSLAVAEYLGTANLTVSGGGTLNTVNATIAAGVNGEGPAATVSGGVAAVGNASAGSLTVSGSGTLWHNTGNVYLGGSDTAAGGLGTLSVVNGGKATIDGQLQIWRDNGATAVVTVGGSGNTGTLAVGQLTNATGTVPVVSLANSGSLLQVGSSANSSFSGVISGPGSVEKLGTGTFTLGNANTYTGGTTLTNGTLQLGAANVLPDSGSVNFNGGTLSTGSGAGFTDAAGPLKLSASSTLALGTGSHTITFDGITGTPNGTLTITGWSGGLNASGTAGRVLFTSVGSTPNATYSGFLSTVQFQGYTAFPSQFISLGGGTYELVPVPEPGAVLAVAFAALGLGAVVARRLRGRPGAGGTNAPIAP